MFDIQYGNLYLTFYIYRDIEKCGVALEPVQRSATQLGNTQHLSLDSTVEAIAVYMKALQTYKWNSKVRFFLLSAIQFNLQWLTTIF